MCECTRVNSVLIKHFALRNVIAFVVNTYNDVEGLEERRMSLLTYGLLEQTTTQHKHKQVERKKRHDTNVRQTLHDKIQTQMRIKKLNLDRTTARMYQTFRKQHKTYQFLGNHILKTKFHACSSTARRALSLKRVTE